MKGSPYAYGAVDLFTVVRLCHDLKTVRMPGVAEPLGDTMEVALVDMAQQVRPEARRGAAFHGDRMRQSVVFETPDGRVLLCKGAPEAVLRRCTAWSVDGRTEPLDDSARVVVAAQEK